MSQQLRVEALMEPHDSWVKMKAVWDACEAAGVGVPDEVAAYFHDEIPEGEGPVVQLQTSRNYRTGDPVVYGLEIDVKDLPKGTRTIRFVVS